MAKNKSKKKKQTVQVEVAKPLNFVAKHMNTFNKATVEVDRKKKAKMNGYKDTKHKGRNEW